MAEETVEGGALELGQEGAWVLRITPPVSTLEPGSEGVPFATDGGVSVLFHGILHQHSQPALEPDPAATVLEAYHREGIEAIEALRGAYVIIVLDAERKEMFAVRDHMGVVPLFWADGGRGVLVSPSARALAAHPEVAPGLNVPAIGEYALLRWLDAQETLYQSVRRVPPGHYLSVSGARREIVRYWQPLARAREDWVAEDQVQHFDEIFATAIDRSLALGTAGIFLSGGLDSVSVAAVAKLESDRSALPPPVALSLAFPHESCNEEDVQRKVARDLGLPQVMLGLYEAAGDTNLLREALELSATWPQPLTNYWIPSYKTLIREGVDRGCKVVLTGTGGDEWLTVTPYYASNLLRRGDVVGLYRLWRGYQRSNPVKARTMAKNLLWQFGARDTLLGFASRSLNAVMPDRLRARRARLIDESFPSWAVPDPELRIAIRERMLAARDDHSERDLYRRELEKSLLHPLVTLEVEEVYEYGNRAGAPIRHPFCDPDVVQFLARMPPELLNRGGRSKGPVRDMVARKLPGLGFERQKKVVATPFASELLLDSLPAVWKDLGGLRHLSALGVVWNESIEYEATRVFTERDTTAVHRLWYLLTLEAWVRGSGQRDESRTS